MSRYAVIAAEVVRAASKTSETSEIPNPAHAGFFHAWPVALDRPFSCPHRAPPDARNGSLRCLVPTGSRSVTTHRGEVATWRRFSSSWC